MPGMPDGKPAGVRCPHLAEDYRCELWDNPARPAVCVSFKPEPQICGESQQDALRVLDLLESTT